MSRHYLLDTNICIHLLHGKFQVKERILKAGMANCYVSDITLAELYYGAYNSPDPQATLEGVNMIARMFRTLSINHAIIQRFGQEKAELRKKGMPIDDFDILIGVTAIVNGMILVTENTKHLARLPITVENWVNRKE